MIDYAYFLIMVIVLILAILYNTVNIAYCHLRPEDTSDKNEVRYIVETEYSELTIKERLRILVGAREFNYSKNEQGVWASTDNQPEAADVLTVTDKMFGLSADLTHLEMDEYNWLYYELK